MRLFLTGRQFLRQIKRLAEARRSERRAACTTRCAASVSPPLFSRVWHTAFPGCALPCSSYPGQQGRARHSPAQLSPTSTWADPPAHFLRTRGTAGSAEGPTAPPHPAFTGARKAKGPPPPPGPHDRPVAGRAGRSQRHLAAAGRAGPGGGRRRAAAGEASRAPAAVPNGRKVRRLREPRCRLPAAPLYSPPAAGPPHFRSGAAAPATRPAWSELPAARYLAPPAPGEAASAVKGSGAGGFARGRLSVARRGGSRGSEP